MLTIFSDEHFMRQALQEAEAAFEEGEVPVGAVVVAVVGEVATGDNVSFMSFSPGSG